jgi:putative MATE family efflux protein
VNDLTTGSVYRHLISLSVPAALGLVFNTLYNLTDFWFAGLLSDDALAGVSIAGSVFFLIIAIGAGMQAGTTAIAASDAGRKQLHAVTDWVDQASGLALLIGTVSLLFGFWVADWLIGFLGAEAHIAPLAKEYVGVVLLGNFAFVLMAVAAGALMALGDTKSNRNALAAGFFANFLLNPLLTFALGLGVTGLALSTVVIKVFSALYLFLILKRTLGKVARPAFSLDRWRLLLAQVLPASFNMLTIILGGFITVSFIGRFGSQHVAGYSVGLRLEQVLLLPALGLFNAVMAIIGQNYGAGHTDRVIETYKKGLIIGLVLSVCLIPVMVFLSPALMGFFSDNEEIISTGSTYLRIDAIAFYAYVVLFISVASLQAVKQPLFPMFLGIARQLVLPAGINAYLILVLDLPMISLFITIVCVVLLSAMVSHWYTFRQLSRLSVASGALDTTGG